MMVGGLPSYWEGIFSVAMLDFGRVMFHLRSSEPFEASSFHDTPLKTNMEPENTTLGREKHLQTNFFWVPR